MAKLGCANAGPATIRAAARILRNLVVMYPPEKYLPLYALRPESGNNHRCASSWVTVTNMTELAKGAESFHTWPTDFTEDIMQNKATRRQFLKSAGMGGALGLGNFAFLRRLPPVSAQEARVTPALVKLDAGIEPLVHLIEETPQADLLEQVARRIHQGTTYQEVVAALFLAGIRNVAPRPTVGFKFHAVMVVNAAHLESLASPDSDRWLPIFWALDQFKNSQAMEQHDSGWRMTPVNESIVPPAQQAKETFIEAMDSWDEKKADAAVAGLVRSAGANEIYEAFYRYGARDFRSIGHKAIFVAHSWRMLQFIGWQHEIGRASCRERG